MNASLNVFQRLFQSWDAVYPYNAIQVVRWRGPISPAAASQAWGSALDAMGLGRVHVEGKQVRHESLNGELKRYPLRVLPAGTDLQSYLSDELNRPFEDPAEPPFRPFLLPDGDSTWLGVVYRHWVADSVSIRMMIREWCERLVEGSPFCNGRLRPGAPAYWELFNSSGHALEQTVFDVWRTHQRFRSALKVHAMRDHDYAVRVVLQSAPTGLIESLKEHARATEVSVGDLLLAALVDAAASHVPMQHRPNRRDLAVGNVLDLRPYSATDLSKTFGLYLGFNSLVFRPADLLDWERLVRAVHTQSRVRRADTARASTIWSAAAVGVQKLMKPDRIYHFYRKEVPLAAGLSNVNLAGTWARERHPDYAMDYLRVSPTGPTTPAVLSVTTLGQKLQLAFTYRQALLTEPQARKMIDHFVARLSQASGFAR